MPNEMRLIESLLGDPNYFDPTVFYSETRDRLLAARRFAATEVLETLPLDTDLGFTEKRFPDWGENLWFEWELAAFMPVEEKSTTIRHGALVTFDPEESDTGARSGLMTWTCFKSVGGQRPEMKNYSLSVYLDLQRKPEEEIYFTTALGMIAKQPELARQERKFLIGLWFAPTCYVMTQQVEIEVVENRSERYEVLRPQNSSHP